MILALSLLLPEVLSAQQTGTARANATNVPAVAAPQSASGTSAQNPQSTRPRSSTQRRSYEREVKPRHHRISKGEIAFMAALAGTSMGVGALAGGAKGLAIGSIVGGWAAYAPAIGSGTGLGKRNHPAKQL